MIEAVTQEEFDSVHYEARGIPTEWGKAIRGLLPGAGIKQACMWKHFTRTCGGSTASYAAAKSRGFKVKFSCRDGVAYAFRPIPEDGYVQLPAPHQDQPAGTGAGNQ